MPSCRFFTAGWGDECKPRSRIFYEMDPKKRGKRKRKKGRKRSRKQNPVYIMKHFPTPLVYYNKTAPFNKVKEDTYTGCPKTTA